MSPDLKKLFRKELIAERAYHLDSYPDLIKLNQNELPYDMDESLKAEWLRRVEALPLHRYPLPQPVRLKKRLAESLGVRPEAIQISNGSNVMIQALILAAGLRGKVLTLDPTFSVYEIEGKLLGSRIVQVGLGEDFRFPLKAILKTMKAARPGLTFIANPNAPTGNLFPEEELLEVLRRAEGLVVIDEAYFQFSGKTLLRALKKYRHLAILRTFSKGFGLGGARIGYLVAHPFVSEQVQKILLPYCVSSLSEATALFVLDHARHFEGLVAAILEERDRMFRAMSALKNIRTYPSDANFILFRSKSAKACFKHLAAKGVLVRDVSNRHSLKNCLRVSVGLPAENDAFLKALASFKA